MLEAPSWVVLTPSGDVLVWLLPRSGGIAVLPALDRQPWSFCHCSTFASPVTALLLSPCAWGHQPGLLRRARWGHIGFLLCSHQAEGPDAQGPHQGSCSLVCGSPWPVSRGTQ